MAPCVTGKQGTNQAPLDTKPAIHLSESASTFPACPFTSIHTVNPTSVVDSVTLSKLRSYENSSFWRLLDVWGRVRGAVCWVQVGYGYARGGRCLGTLGTLVRCEGTTEGYVGYAVWEQCVCLLVAVVLLCCLHHTTNQIQ